MIPKPQDSMHDIILGTEIYLKEISRNYIIVDVIAVGIIVGAIVVYYHFIIELDKL